MTTQANSCNLVFLLRSHTTLTSAKSRMWNSALKKVHVSVIHWQNWFTNSLFMIFRTVEMKKRELQVYLAAILTSLWLKEVSTWAHESIWWHFCLWNCELQIFHAPSLKTCRKKFHHTTYIKFDLFVFPFQLALLRYAIWEGL